MPNERNYYVICDDNCRFPAMTAEQVLEAIAEATGNVPQHVEDAFITQIKEQNRNQNMKVWIGTQAQYNLIAYPSSSTLYIITDVNTSADLNLYAKKTEVAAVQSYVDAVKEETEDAIKDIQSEIDDLPSFPLSIANGGTGVTTLDALQALLGNATGETLATNIYMTRVGKFRKIEFHGATIESTDIDNPAAIILQLQSADTPKENIANNVAYGIGYVSSGTTAIPASIRVARNGYLQVITNNPQTNVSAYGSVIYWTN